MIDSWKDVLVFLNPYFKDRKCLIEIGAVTFDPIDFVPKAKLSVNGEEVAEINMEEFVDGCSLGKQNNV